MTPSLAPSTTLLLDELFPLTAALATRVFVVIDGAASPDLTERLCEWEPRHMCLYSGELTPDLARAAPYLVEVERDDAFLKWFLEDGDAKNWGVIQRATCELPTLRRHWRTLSMVRMPDGRVVYFRLYDPRVASTYLPTCTNNEAAMVFGPVEAFYVQDESEPHAFRRFERGVDRIRFSTIG